MKNTCGWYFCRLTPSNTLLAVEPNGKEHVVKHGDMNSLAGHSLFNSMAAALCGIAPTTDKTDPPSLNKVLL